MPDTLWKDDQYVLNYCTKYLARDSTDARHDFGQYFDGDLRATIAECWRFPIIDSYYDPDLGYDDSYRYNLVTFIYKRPSADTVVDVSVIGTHATLHELRPLRPIAGTAYSALSVRAEKGRSYRYRFVIDDRSFPDPINVQQVTMPNGDIWSRFFTQLCTETLSFETWEMRLLERLVNHILPFRTTEGQRFVDQYIANADRGDKDEQYTHAFRMEQDVGAAAFIDKFVAREEAHHLVDYKTCLELIDQLLRHRDPYVEPAEMPLSMFDDLYDQMAHADNVRIDAWDYGRYQNPRYFLQLLRRHTYTGAFSHPKYGGNVGGAGWSYLEQLTRDPTTGQTFFDWRRSQESPLGRDTTYHG